jgi:competence protein ComEA
MRRESGDEVAAVARRRLELLGRELARAGRPVDEAQQPVEPVALPEPVVVPAPGRHARARRESGRVAGRLEARLPAALVGRVALRPGHLVLLVVVLVTALAATAWWTLGAAPEPVPVAHVSPGPAPTTASPSGVPVEVVVDIAGKVRRPGVATLPAGSRVVDALKRAGGARGGVDLSTLNLARVLVDGEQILVGVAPVGGVAATTPPAPGGTALVNLNTSTVGELEALPGVGPVTAQKILDWRTEHGSFTAVDELLEVAGIGSKTFAEIAPHVTL